MRRELLSFNLIEADDSFHACYDSTNMSALAQALREWPGDRRL